MGIKINNGLIYDNGVGISVSKDVELEINNTKLFGNDVAIEVRDDLMLLFNSLKTEILNSKFDKSSKERLIKEVLEIINSNQINENNKNQIKTKILKFIGEKAADFFVQILAIISTS